MNKKIYSDTGPLIHLSEIDAIEAFGIFDVIYLPVPVIKELNKKDLPGHSITDGEPFRTYTVSDVDRETASDLIEKYKMTSNDALILASAIGNQADIILTDDLEVRSIAELEGVIPVGSIGILLRSYRVGIVSMESLLKRMDDLLLSSSLFITPDIIDHVKNEVKMYEHRNG